MWVRGEGWREGGVWGRGEGWRLGVMDVVGCRCVV